MPTGTPSSPDAVLTRERLADQTVIAITGELDIASTPSIREQLHVALQDTGAQVIIDLSGVPLCDTSGLAMLVGTRRRREAKSATVILAAPRPQLARPLEATGLLHAFTVHTSFTEARTTGPGTRSAAA